ncbi:hypothetical protein [Streptomyces sp. NPDC051211]|uniref:hypothetical protein n=1 Tax=Streptomyces sp. NPDC051211 TaxID=3154643 RepID=UPI00344E0BB5
MQTTGVEDEVAARLAEAADGVSVGPVPVDAVIRGGRRRRTRRSLLTGALALAVLVPLGGVAVSVAREDRATKVVQTPQPPEGDQVTTDLGTVEIDGNVFRAEITMSRTPFKGGLRSGGVVTPPPGWFGLKDGPWPWTYVVFQGSGDYDQFNRLHFGPEAVMPDPEGMVFRWGGLEAKRPDGYFHLLYNLHVGRLKPEVRRAVITWKDGTTSEPTLHTVPHSAHQWLIAMSKPGQYLDYVDLYDASGHRTRKELW